MIKINNRFFLIILVFIFLTNCVLSADTIGKNISLEEIEHYPAFYYLDVKVVQISLSDINDLGTMIKKGIDVVDVKDMKVTAYITNNELEWLILSGFKPTILFNSIKDMVLQSYPPGTLLDFHTYDTMTTELEEIADNYPDIAELYDLGTSVQGRTIWGLKITDNVGEEENEPEVRICGCHHGNEFMSVELPLLLALHLVENYESDTYIEDLVDNREIWIIPMVNPDGREASSRYNANGVDINRDYGYLWGGEGGSPGPFSQPETKVIRDNALENNFILSLSYHTTAAYVNYIWNYKEDPAPDDEVIVDLSYQYAASTGYTSIRGYNWYQTRGDTNDFSYGCRGGIDWTIETENSNIEATWEKNRDAMLNIIEAADMGVSGIVTDAYTDEPINATVWVEEAFWPCFTDPTAGDYHRMLPPGTYTIHFQANGYEEQVHEIEIPESFAPTNFNVSLIPENNFYAYQVTWCIFYDPYSYPNNFQNNPSEGISALGYPDGIYASLGEGGSIVLDMGVEGEIIDLEDEPDFKIFEGGTSDDSYEVYISSNWNGPWTYMGLGEGTTEFDLNDVSVDSAQFVKIIDDDNGDPYEINPGVDIDAIQCLKTPITPSEPPTVPEIDGPTLGKVGTECNFSFVSTDPEDKTISYFVDWGDETNSDWIGPYPSGEVVYESHVWTEKGDFEVKAKAMDNDNVQSPWSAPYSIHIDMPILDIGSIRGGLFRVKTMIKNNGGIDATGVEWKIVFEGGAIIGKETTGIDTINAGDEIEIRSNLIIGFGSTQVTVEVQIPDGISDVRKQGGFVYFIFVNINPGG